MFNQPFNTGQNPAYPQPQQPYGGYSQQYNPPQPTMSFAIIEGKASVDNYLVGTNVTAILADFTNMKLYIKERDVNNILKPLREFDITERFSQQSTNGVNMNRVVEPRNQNESNMQSQIDELKSMMQTLINNQSNNQPKTNPNKPKGGNN